MLHSDAWSRVGTLSAQCTAVHGDTLMLTCLRVMLWGLLTDVPLLFAPHASWSNLEGQHSSASLEG